MPLKKRETPHLRVLIDTPLWKEYFRREGKVFRQVNALMDRGRVCSLDLIIAELLDAAATDEEVKVCQDFARIFPILIEPEAAWTRTAEWTRKWKRRGKKCPLRDAYLAFMAKTHGVLLWSRNPIFRSLRGSSASGFKIFREEGGEE